MKFNPSIVHPSKDVKFSTNWNGKLRTKFFTTIRLNSTYYVPGEFYQIWAKEKQIFGIDDKGILVELAKPITKDVYQFNAYLHSRTSVTLDKLPAITAALDTGYTLAEAKGIFKRMYPNADWKTQLLDILLFENIQYQP